MDYRGDLVYWYLVDFSRLIKLVREEIDVWVSRDLYRQYYSTKGLLSNEN